MQVGNDSVTPVPPSRLNRGNGPTTQEPAESVEEAKPLEQLPRCSVVALLMQSRTSVSLVSNASAESTFKVTAQVNAFVSVHAGLLVVAGQCAVPLLGSMTWPKSFFSRSTGC